MIGTCRLCQKLNCELQMSHLLPAAGYERLRNSGEPGRHPVVINPEVTLESSWQAQSYLLCQECEKLFNSKGEDWILRNCWLEDEFPLHSTLVSASPVTVTPQVKTFSAAAIAKIDVEKIAYFAASIFGGPLRTPGVSQKTQSRMPGSLALMRRDSENTCWGTRAFQNIVCYG